MDRRRILAVLATGATGGCLRLGSGTPTDPSSPTATRSATATETAAGTDTATDTDTPTDTDTATDTDSPTDTETPTEDGTFDYPSGASPDGLSETLGSAHQVALASTPATVERDGAGLQIVARVDGERIVGDPGRFDGDIYIDGEAFSLRGTVDGELLYDYTTDVPETYRRKNIVGTPVVSALAGGGDWEVTGTSRVEGRQVLDVVADGVADGSIIENTTAVSRRLPGSFTVTDLTGTGQITESGVASELTADVTVESAGGDTVTRTFGVATSDIGETTVQTPNWLSRAKRNAPTFAAELLDDRSVLALSLTGGTDLAGGFEFDTYDDDGYYNAAYDGTFAVGDTLYIWKTGPQAAAVTTSPPDAGEPVAAYVGTTKFDVRVGPITLERLRPVGESSGSILETLW